MTALEPSKKLCREIRKVFLGEIVCSDIQSYQPDQRFDGIWACASLLHCGKKSSCFFEKMDLYLNDNGILYFSGKNGIPTGRAADGRYFLEFTEQLVEKILAANETNEVGRIVVYGGCEWEKGISMGECDIYAL